MTPPHGSDVSIQAQFVSACTHFLSLCVLEPVMCMISLGVRDLEMLPVGRETEYNVPIFCSSTSAQQDESVFQLQPQHYSSFIKQVLALFSSNHWITLSYHCTEFDK